MKYSDFKLVKIIGDSPINWKFKASVTETSGWFFKKKRTIYVCRSFGSSWFFLDTGKYTPNLEIENLEKIYTFLHGVDLEYCPLTK